MKIREIENKELRELAELRRKECGWDFKTLTEELVDELVNAFAWRKTEEGVSFWADVNNGIITELPEEDCSITEKAFSSITVESELRVANEIIKVLEAEILELRELLKKQR